MAGGPDVHSCCGAKHNGAHVLGLQTPEGSDDAVGHLGTEDVVSVLVVKGDDTNLSEDFRPDDGAREANGPSARLATSPGRRGLLTVNHHGLLRRQVLSSLWSFPRMCSMEAVGHVGALASLSNREIHKANTCSSLASEAPQKTHVGLAFVTKQGYRASDLRPCRAPVALLRPWR
jgi:hypothetical protein